MNTTLLNTAIETLQTHKTTWARLPIPQKIVFLEQLRADTDRLGQQWVALSCQHKQIDINTPWAGEEWMGGPWAFLTGINGILDTLAALAEGRKPSLKKVRTRPGGQTIAQVFPNTLYDKLILSGVHAEVWMQEGVTPDNLAETMAQFYDKVDPAGHVSLVLGAGNVSSIPILDTLHKLYTDGEVVLLKMNPVNAYLGPVYEDLFAPFIAAGYVQFTYGGAEVGNYLVQHPRIETIHMTGSAKTHDAIVFGTGEEGRVRKQHNTPRLKKPITSELGGVGPCIVVPGPWTKADIRFQAENIVTTKLNNSGFNCVASQVLILPERWEHSHTLLNEIRDLMIALPTRPAYYPGVEKRQQEAVRHHPTAEILDDSPVPRTLITQLDPTAENEYCFNAEFFGTVLAQTSLPGATPAIFLRNVVEFCNDKLDGTLGATLIIHPQTMKALGKVFEGILADLRYGAIGVNQWNAGAYLLAQCAWGAYPGHTLDNIESGIGVVHNSFMFAKPQKTVIYGPFRPFPRSWRYGEFHTTPRPAWFVTNPTAHTTAKQVAKFTANPSLLKLPAIFVSALRGNGA